MKKEPFVTLEKLNEITEKFPTPFHLYDEKGIRENAKALKEAFAWNKGFKEFFAVKATPNPYLINILQEYGCGCDCSSETELMMAKAVGCKKGDIMFSSNDTPEKELTAEQEAAYRLNLESYRQLERDPDAENRETRMLDLDNAFHRRAFELCGMEEHFDHMLSTFQHIERLRKFSLQTEENKSVCAAHTRILEAVLRGSEEDLSRALSDHLNRYKLSVEQARQRHPEYFTEGTVRPVDYHI